MLTLIVLLGIVSVCHFANGILLPSSCDYMALHNNNYGTGAFLYFYNTGIKLCGIECFRRLECLSITYYRLRNLCYLQTNEGMFSAQNYVYVEMSQWNLTSNLGECATRPCPIHHRCTLLSNNNYTCVRTECDYGVGADVPHLSGWNWRWIGRTKTLKCGNDYYLNGTTVTSTCRPNGTWTYNNEIEAECVPIPVTTTVTTNSTSGWNDTTPADWNSTMTTYWNTSTESAWVVNTTSGINTTPPP